MDCQQLGEDIKNLETELEQISGEIAEFSDSEDIDKKRLVELDKTLSELEQKRDEVLEKNLDEFFARHPELFKSEVFSYSAEEMPDVGFHINHFQSLSDTRIMVMGYDGGLKIIEKKDDGWVCGPQIDAVGDDVGFVTFVTSQRGRSENEVVLFWEESNGGDSSVTIIKEEDGVWWPDMFEGSFVFNSYINTSERLSDGRIVAMGDDNLVYVMDPMGSAKSGQWGITAGNIDSEDVHIYGSLLLSDASMMVFESGGKARIMRDRELVGRRMSWEFGSEEIPDFGVEIFSAQLLSDTEILVMGQRRGQARILRQKDDGNWEYDQGIQIPESGFNITASLKLSDTEILVGGGKMKILRREEKKDVETLKKNLSRLNNKKDKEA